MNQHSGHAPGAAKLLRGLRAGNPFERAARVAIVGGSRAGKSVLLTSLLDHLRHFDAARFRLETGTFFQRTSLDPRDFTEEPLPEPPTRFPYEAFRAQVTEAAAWPRKTCDAYQIRIRLSARIGPFGLRVPLLLTFLDFPGERFADAPMAGSGYAEWSDAMERSLLAGPDGSGAIAAFRRTRENPTAGEEDLTTAYRRVLAESIRDYRVLISPSVFALGTGGDLPPRGADAEALAKGRLCGLDAGRAFAPLDAAARQRHPTLARTFEGHYSAYRAALVDPLFGALKRCDRLAFLVNLPEILQSGVGALNDTGDLLQNVLAGCLPDTGLLARSTRAFANRMLPLLLREEWRPGGVGRIALVATQADRIHPGDVDRMRRLLRELAAPVLRNAGAGGTARIELFTCAAVRATEVRGERLLGVPATESGAAPAERAPHAYTVSRLPDAWPGQWDPADFSFEDILPRFSPNRRRPPAQSGLDTLFQFLLP